MKLKFLPLASLSFLLIGSNQAFSQNTGYAITAQTKGSYNWNSIKEIDLKTGKVIRTIYDPAGISNIQIKTTDGQPMARNNQYITSNGVAAAAFDANTNRLYFTPMRGNTLNYFDLNDGKTVVVNANRAFNTGIKNTEANVITRMCFAADGFGYALTNDGNNLIKFSTADNAEVINLGQLKEGKKNGNTSIHNQCTGWGGDMIADVYGNLWVFTMKNNVFKINPNTMVADYEGSIKGLPAEFTVNGAAVDEDGYVIVSSAALTNQYYRINISTLEATGINNGEGVYNASDLASRHFAYSKEAGLPVTIHEVKTTSMFTIYPNPVTNHQMRLSYSKLPSGKYSVEVADLSGRKVQTQSIELRGTDSKMVSLDKSAAKGMYLVKVTNAEGAIVYQDKILVQ